MLQLLDRVDSALLLFFNFYHTPWLDSAMFFMSSKWAWVPMYVALAVMFVKIFGWRRGVAYVLLIGAWVALADQVCASVIRPMVCRLRPSNLENPLSEFVTVVNGYRGGSYGFPSCHAANSFVLASFTALILRRWRLGVSIFAWAALNSFTRLYLGVHYPGDILVGAVIGCACGYAAYRAALLVRADAPAPRGVVWSGNNTAMTITVGDIAISVLVMTVFYSLLFA